MEQLHAQPEPAKGKAWDKPRHGWPGDPVTAARPCPRPRVADKRLAFRWARGIMPGFPHVSKEVVPWQRAGRATRAARRRSRRAWRRPARTRWARPVAGPP